MNRTSPHSNTRSAGRALDAAALALFGPDIRLVPCVTFDDLFRAVSTGSAACGAVPIENTLAGSVSRNYDLLGEHELHVIGETRVRVRLCLAVRPGTTLTDIHSVASHPVALEQCRRFFATHPGMQLVPTYDTAGGVRDLMAGKSGAEAAIGSALAAELYGATIALQGIEDHAENYTRFLAISPETPYAADASRATLVFTPPQRSGSTAPGTRHLRRARVQSDQDRIAADSRPAVGIRVLCRRPSRPGIERERRRFRPPPHRGSRASARDLWRIRVTRYKSGRSWYPRSRCASAATDTVSR